MGHCLIRATAKGLGSLMSPDEHEQVQKAGFLSIKFTNICCNVTVTVVVTVFTNQSSNIKDFAWMFHHCQLTYNVSLSVRIIQIYLFLLLLETPIMFLKWHNDYLHSLWWMWVSHLEILNSPSAWETELFHPAVKIESEVKLAVLRPTCFCLLPSDVGIVWLQDKNYA